MVPLDQLLCQRGVPCRNRDQQLQAPNWHSPINLGATSHLLSRTQSCQDESVPRLVTDEIQFSSQVYGQIKAKKTLSYGKLRLERKQEASTVAQRDPVQRIELMRADNAEIDFHE